MWNPDFVQLCKDYGFSIESKSLKRGVQLTLTRNGQNYYFVGSTVKEVEQEAHTYLRNW